MKVPFFRRIISISFIVLFFLVLSSCKNRDKEVFKIHYNIIPQLGENPRLAVSFKAKADSLGNLNLKYENESWGDKGLFECIKGFKVYPRPSRVEFLPDSSSIVVRTEPFNELMVSYHIIQDFQGPLLNRFRNRPIVQEDYFHILGMRLFIYPEDIFLEDDATAKVGISWSNKGKNIFVHSSLGREQDIIAQLNKEQLYTSVFMGGDMVRMELEVPNQSVYFITRPNWKEVDIDAIPRLLKQTIVSQTNFFGDSVDSLFSVSLLPTYEPWNSDTRANSIGGSSLPHSFVSFASDNKGTTFRKLAWLYNHELLHQWIGLRIKNRNEEEQYWFSEGFTEYYAYKLMYGSGILDVETYKKIILDDFIDAHANSPVKSIPNDSISYHNFWNDEQYQKLPYRRGFLYALYLDMKITKKTKGEFSLDDLLLDIYSEATTNPLFRLDRESFSRFLLFYLGQNPITEFDQFITQGLPIKIDMDSLDRFLVCKQHIYNK